MERSVFWSDWDTRGLQHLHLAYQGKEIIATGTILSYTENIPFHTTYRILCDDWWCVRSIELALHNSDSTVIKLKTGSRGHWTDTKGTVIPSLTGCIDVDISATPFTNTLPIRRLKLAVGECADIHVVYFKVPEMTFEPVEQRYTCLARTATGETYRYDGLTSNFQAELPIDQDGLVLDYPQLFRRVESSKKLIH